MRIQRGTSGDRTRPTHHPNQTKLTAFETRASRALPSGPLYSSQELLRTSQHKLVALRCGSRLESQQHADTAGVAVGQVIEVDDQVVLAIELQQCAGAARIGLIDAGDVDLTDKARCDGAVDA